MKRTKVIDLILRIAKQPNTFDILEGTFAELSKNELSASLLECGIIPELFEHDSSEEKLWAKYCDILLAHAWSQISIDAEVLRTRGNSADVFGRTERYTIVGDAKAFRLSRTAKNQKDFKIKALDDWRKNDTYACLVSPLYQYPSNASQIYEQAIERNVTLLSYIHLKFLIDHYGGEDLSPLWGVSKSLPKSSRADVYWNAVDKTMCELLGESENVLRAYEAEEIKATKKLGEEGIIYWEEKIKAYKKLSKVEAVRRLIKAEKIEAKVSTIRRAIQALENNPPVPSLQ